MELTPDLVRGLLLREAELQREIDSALEALCARYPAAEVARETGLTPSALATRRARADTPPAPPGAPERPATTPKRVWKKPPQSDTPFPYEVPVAEAAERLGMKPATLWMRARYSHVSARQDSQRRLWIQTDKHGNPVVLSEPRGSGDSRESA